MLSITITIWKFAIISKTMARFLLIIPHTLTERPPEMNVWQTLLTLNIKSTELALRKPEVNDKLQ